jgi:hypothetical protein
MRVVAVLWSTSATTAVKQPMIKAISNRMHTAVLVFPLSPQIMNAWMAPQSEWCPPAGLRQRGRAQVGERVMIETPLKVRIFFGGAEI